MAPEGDFDLLAGKIAAAIHNNHGAPPGSVTCFMCRRDAVKVLSELYAAGFLLRRSGVAVPLPEVALVGP